jgi:hypothetical protein
MAEDFDFNTNLMRLVAGQLHFLLGITAAREMFGKSYFALGAPEKAALDQAVVTGVLGNYQVLTPEFLVGPKSPQQAGFGIPAAAPKQEKS